MDIPMVVTVDVTIFDRRHTHKDREAIKATNKLRAKDVENVKPGEKPYKLADGEGF